MSTHSLICKENTDGTYTGIYCHWDGYPAHHGKILTKHYTTRDKVDALLALGDLYQLKEEIAPPPGVTHDWGHSAEGVCIAYHRDCGDDYIPPFIYALVEIVMSSQCEYAYVFGLDGKWRFFNLEEMRQTSEFDPNPWDFDLFDYDFARGYYDEPDDAIDEEKCSLTIDDIINGVPTEEPTPIGDSI